MPHTRPLVLALWLCALAYGHAEYDDVRSPLDLSYILNDLSAVQKELGLGANLPQQSSGKPGDYVYPHGVDPAESSGRGRDDQTVRTSLYSNNAGDAVFGYKKQPGRDTNAPLAQVPFGSSLSPRAATGLTGAPQQGVEYIYPLYTENGGDSQRGTDLRSFGQNLPAVDHYPIEVPPSSPDVRYSNGGLNQYPVQKRQIIPSPYSKLNVPYSVNNGAGNYNSKDNYNSNDIYNNNDNYNNYNTNDNTVSNENYNSNNGQGGGRSRGNTDQSLQPSYKSDGTSKDLSGLLSNSFPSPISSNFLGANAGHYPPSADSNDYSALGGDNYPGGAGGHGPVGLGQAFPEPQSPAGSGPGSVAGYVAGGQTGSGGQYVVGPQYTYPVDVYDYRKDLQCWPQFFLEYEHDFTGAVWQDVKGHVQVQEGRAVFQGQGFLAIPFFACNDLLPRYSMIFVISPSYSGGGTQAVLGNSAFSDKASLLVSLSGNTLSLVIRQRPPGLTPHQLLAQCSRRRRRSVGGGGHYRVSPGVGAGFQSQPVGHGDAGHSSLTGEVVVLQLTISGEVLVTIAQENDWIYFSAGDQQVTKPGRLPSLTNEALYVGAGADPRGGNALAHYSGTFDSFLFEKCP